MSVGQPIDDDLITVCDSCLRASCWNGIFYCEDYKEAGIVQRTVTELRELGYEHEDYWPLQLRSYATGKP